MAAADDEDTRNGIEPEVWGKAVWDALHYISMDYPTAPKEQEIQRFRAFFEALQTVLPCATCREHYSAYWQTHSIDPFLASGNLKQWVLDLHNAVNRRLHKPQWTLAMLQERYGSVQEDQEVPPQQFSLMISPLLPPVPIKTPQRTVFVPRLSPPPAPLKKRGTSIRRNFGAHDLSTALPTRPRKKCKNCGKKN